MIGPMWQEAMTTLRRAGFEPVADEGNIVGFARIGRRHRLFRELMREGQSRGATSDALLAMWNELLVERVMES